MDTLAALALATEPPTDALLLQKPHGKTERFISNIMWKNIMLHAIFQVLALLAILYAGYLIPWTSGPTALQSTRHYTIVFNTFVWMQLFNEINAHSIDDHQNVFKGLYKNPIFIVVMIVSVAIQAIVVEFGGAAFKTVGLSWDQWLFCIGVGALELPLGFIIRALPVPNAHYLDTLQFWNRAPILRTTRIKAEPFYRDGTEMQLIEADLLPEEEAFQQIEQERERLAEQKRIDDEQKLARYADLRAKGFLGREEDAKSSKGGKEKKKKVEKKKKKTGGVVE